MEELRHVRISVELDTNKATYADDFGNVMAFAAWWNERADELRLPPILLATPTEAP